MVLSSLRRWCCSQDPLVAIAVSWEGLTVTYSDRHRKIRCQTFPCESHSASLPSRLSLDSSARAMRAFIPNAARRCGFVFSSSRAYLSNEVPFDSQGMFVRRTSLSAPGTNDRDLFFAIRTSMARRFCALAERAQLDVDFVTHGSVTTFHALRALRLFSHADTIGVITVDGHAICIDEFDRGGWRTTHSFAIPRQGSSKVLLDCVRAFLDCHGDIGCLVEDSGVLSREIFKSLKHSGGRMLEGSFRASLEAHGVVSSNAIPQGMLSCLGLLVTHSEWEEALLV